MPNELEPARIAVTPSRSGELFIVPAIIADAGDRAGKRFIEFFTATIRNANTRKAYARAVNSFLAWCQQGRLTLTGIEPVHVAASIEHLTQSTLAVVQSQTLLNSMILTRHRLCLDE